MIFFFGSVLLLPPFHPSLNSKVAALAAVEV